MIALSVLRGLAVASVVGSLAAVAACGGGTVAGSSSATDAGGTNGDVSSPDASGDDDTTSDAGAAADVAPDIQQNPNVYPATHHPLPQVDKGNGPILDQMKIVNVTFGADANVDLYTAFTTQIGSTMWWQQALMPYGISPAVVSANIVLPDTVSGTSITDSQLQMYLEGEISSGALPVPDAETLYVIFAPRNFNVSMPVGTSSESSCMYFDGYHSSFGATIAPTTDGGSVTGVTAAYAMIFNCGYGGTKEIEVTASHEIAEAATDPHPDLTPTYYLHSDDAWSQVFAGFPADEGAEVADLCDGTPWSEGTYFYNTIYSNAAAALSKNPCQPATDVFYAAAVDTVKATAGGYASDGFLLIKPGATISVEVDFFSDAALPNDVTLTVGAPNYGGELSTIVGGVTTSLSQTTAHNGDGIILTITADASTVGGNYPFVVRSQLNASSFNDWAVELRVE